MKKILIYVMAVVMLLSTWSVNVGADTGGKACGPSATWTLDKNGTLTITGKGIVNKKFLDDEMFRVSKVKKLDVKGGINEIGEGCFWNFYNMKTVSLPDTLVKINKDAFIGCEEIKKVEIPDSVIEIGEDCFSGCEKLNNVKLPKNLTSLPRAVFSFCKKLEKIDFPQNLKTIGAYAFSDCNSLTKITIPDSVTKIKTGAFSDCKKLTTITLGKSIQKVSPKFIKDSISVKKIVNKSSVDISLYNYKGKKIWYVGKKKTDILPAGKTARAKGKKYKIIYDTDGGKIRGKKVKSYRYSQGAALPKKVKKKGYTFFGWNIFMKRDWDMVTTKIRKDSYGTTNAYAVFKKYKVENVKGRKIKVTVKDSSYGTKGYEKEIDTYMFRYSKYKDMRDAVEVSWTYPYGDGLSSKLKKGETYYVQVGLDPYWAWDIDPEGPASGWLLKRKVTIKK